MATPKQIAANRLNSQWSTGPKSPEGKEVARRNSLKHGLTGLGVVIPGEDEGEVAIREVAFREQLVDEGDALGGALVRNQRGHSAFRHLSLVGEVVSMVERTEASARWKAKAGRKKGDRRCSQAR